MKARWFVNSSYLLHAVLVGIACMFFVACNHSKRLHAPAIESRAKTPMLDVDSVSTLISDSGVVRYRINAPRWQIFDKDTPSYWLFPEGIYLEKFDENLIVDASLKADYAKYLDQQEIWELDGHVFSMNEKGETFATEQLFWDQRTERVYSDSSIVITRESSVIMGVGFESNQTMTQYTILNPTGYFPVEE